MADHRHEYCGRSRTWSDAMTGIFGRSHRLKVMISLDVARRRW